MPFVSAAPLDTMLDEDAPGRCADRISDAAGDRLLQTTKRFTPVDRSRFRDKPTRPRGTARASLERTPVQQGGNQGRKRTVKVRTFDPVFPYIEFNTRPHVIRAKNPTGRLSFRSQKGFTANGKSFPAGTRVRPQEVNHPGTQGQHPFARAALQLSGTVDQVAAEPLARFRSELARSIP